VEPVFEIKRTVLSKCSRLRHQNSCSRQLATQLGRDSVDLQVTERWVQWIGC